MGTKEAEMAQILVRDLDEKLVARLKVRAKDHGRSLQGEVKAILEGSVKYSMEDARKMAEEWRQQFAGRIQGDSADLLREDRDR